MPLSPETTKSLFDDLRSTQQPETPAETPTPAPTTAAEPATPVADAPAADASAETPPAAEATTEQPVNPFLAELQQLGFKDVDSEEAARQRLLEAYRTEQQRREQYESQLQQFAPLLQYGRQYLERMQDPEFAQFAAQRQSRVQQPPQPEQPKSWWTPPEYNPAVADRYREVDPTTGQVRWKENTPIDVRTAYDSHQAYIQNWAEQLVRDPVKALDGFRQQVLEEAKSLIRRDWEQTQQQQTQQQFIQQVEQQHSDWMYQRDPRTGEVLRNFDGQMVPTAWGQRALEYVTEANQYGIPSPQARWEYALARVKADYADAMWRQQQVTPAAASTTSPASTLDQTIASTKNNILERGRVNNGNLAAPNRTGSEDRVDTPSRRSQNSKLSPGRKFLAELKRG